MSKIIAIHSFRGGTGKSNTTANLAVLLAANGRRVGVVDTDIQSPGIHALFGLEREDLGHTLNEYLWGKCEISEVAHDMSSRLGLEHINGEIFLVPSSMKTNDITKILRDGYDAGLLTEGFDELIDDLDLDILMIDTHPGLNHETLLSIMASDVLVLLMRPDQQDIQGTVVTVDVARKLHVSNMLLVVNKTPETYDFEQITREMERIYTCQVAAILPHSDEMMELGGKGIFALTYPEHPITVKLRQMAAQLLMIKEE